jgi:hypothetical protein
MLPAPMTATRAVDSSEARMEVVVAWWGGQCAASGIDPSVKAWTTERRCRIENKFDRPVGK